MRDVIVIGGNLAGLNAARFAASHGADVLLFERKKEIGIDVCCGESVVEDVLWDAGIPFPKDPALVKMPIRRLQFSLYNGKTYTLDLKSKKGYVLDRAHLERMLASDATAQGAEIRTGVNIGRKDLVFDFEDRIGAGGEWCKHLIGADGLETLVGRISRLTWRLPQEDMGKAYQETVVVHGTPPWRDGQINVYWSYKDEVGYGWLFPMGGGEAHIGMGVAGPIAGSYLKIVQKELREELLDGYDYEVKRAVGKTMPLAKPLDHVVKKNGETHISLVGDAARTCLAHLGSGMGGALVSGRVCGHAWRNPWYYQVWYADNWYDRGMKAWKIKEKVWNNPKRLFRWAPLVLFVHKLFPGLIEKYAFASARYVSMV